MEKGLANPKLKNFFIDLSWTELAKYIVEKPENTAAVADLVNRYPDRFLFGTDEVAPKDQAGYLKIYDIYQPLLAQLTPDAKEKLLKGNYERLFDEARARVRAWERVNVK
jgi:predicted TIM-barrel fold metal-dependent hydrolase